MDVLGRCRIFAVPALCVLIQITGIIGCRRNPESRTTTLYVPTKNAHGIRNVVFISVDTLRADHLACYGHQFIKTPNIDALAEDGVLFTQCMTAVSTTLSSHTCMMTGTYPHTHGVVRNGYFVNDKNLMLAEILKHAGFVTAGFIGAVPLDTRVHFDQGFDHYDTEYTWGEGYQGGQQRRANEVTDAVLRWLDGRQGTERESTRAKERLFLFVHYFDPHSPYTAPAPFGGMYRRDSRETDGGMKVIERTRDLLRSGYRWSAQQDRTEQPQRIPADIQANMEEGYALAVTLDAEYSAEVSFADHHLGRLMDGLKSRGLYDNSLVIFTSDHGETMYEHFNVFNHGQSVYETEIHVPLILHFPGGKYRGRRIPRLTSNIDLAPTILALLSSTPPEEMEGRSFAGALEGTLPPRRPVFAEATQPWNIPEFNNDPVWPNRLKFHCIRTQRYKYMVRLPDQKSAFFDLQADPIENMNLIQNSNGYDAAVLKQLQRDLLTWWKDAHPLESRSVDAEDHLEALRSLGYVGD